MARIKKHRHAQNHSEMKHRHKPNIPELVYKYLIANQVFDDTERRLVSERRCYGEEKHHNEVIESTSRNIDRDIGYRVRQGHRKNSGRISKAQNIKQHPTSKDLSISYLQKCVNGEDIRKARRYMKKALEFGVESGYLIPSDPTYKILRVSSDLMKSDSRRSKSVVCNTAHSKNRHTPIRLEKSQQEPKRRQRKRGIRRQRRSRSSSRIRRSRSRRRRRRSGSRSKGHRRSPQNSEEVAEDKVDDYEMDENDPKGNNHADDVEREPKTVQSNEPDEERFMKEVEEECSDLSIDEDETDDENEKKN